MDKCETCKWKNAEDGWAVCDCCAHAPYLEDKYKPLTNADRIRSMSEEELAKIITCPYDNALESCIPGSNCLECCEKWLQQPYESPTVDAVEVVRCRDCKHMEITPDNLRWCNAWNSINGMGDEGYCNYGERKEG